MGAMRKVYSLVIMGIAALAVMAATAGADGLPSAPGGPPAPNVGPEGVTTPGSPSRFVTLGLGRRTMLARVDKNGGQVTGSRLVKGSFTIPAVAYDGTPSGISADGSTLVLIHPRQTFPQGLTKFALVDARTLRTRERLNLHGDFSFDAVSPDGKTLFFVQYLSPTDATRYAVRAYDVDAGRLLPEPIVDPQEAAEKMAGRPKTRVLGPGGRWAYTLYDGAGKAPFVHALDTTSKTAVCIEMPQLAGAGVPPLSSLSLRVDEGGNRLSVVSLDGSPLLQVDTQTFAVTEPGASGSDGHGFPLVWFLGAAGLIACVAVLVRRARARSPLGVPAAER